MPKMSQMRPLRPRGGGGTVKSVVSLKKVLNCEGRGGGLGGKERTLYFLPSLGLDASVWSQGRVRCEEWTLV